MKRLSPLAFLIAISTAAIGADATAPSGSDEPWRQRLESIREEIQDTQRQFEAAVAERFRQRDRAEFDIPDIAELRVAAKQLEKEVLDLRRDLNLRLTARYPAVRDLERRQDEAFQEVRKRKTDLIVLERELASLRATGAAPERIGQSEQDVRAAAAELEALNRQAAEAMAELNKQRDQGAAADTEAAERLELLRAAEQDYQLAVQRLHERLDREPSLQDLDSGRIALANKLIELRRQEQAILDQGAAGPAP
jgi:chromosome segregation ATPase